jgi:AbrB family looped-hinge helix DNA binding protein
VKGGDGTLLIPVSLGNTFEKEIITEGDMSTTVTTKGQVTIPKSVRDLLGLKPGTKVEFKAGVHGEIILTRADEKRPPSRFAKFIGHAGPGLSTDEIMALMRGDD